MRPRIVGDGWGVLRIVGRADVMSAASRRMARIRIGKTRNGLGARWRRRPSRRNILVGEKKFRIKVGAGLAGWGGQREPECHWGWQVC